MPEVYFQNLPTVLCRYLSDARTSIRIAVCWFSHRNIFEVLLKKLRAGIPVEILLEYGSQNIHANGLDFQKFTKLGGILYAYRDTALMHHKFALLDERLLLTGSSTGPTTAMPKISWCLTNLRCLPHSGKTLAA